MSLGGLDSEMLTIAVDRCFSTRPGSVEIQTSTIPGTVLSQLSPAVLQPPLSVITRCCRLLVQKLTKNTVGATRKV